jgi:membrane fusion protein (multidrug efflux system)
MLKKTLVWVGGSALLVLIVMKLAGVFDEKIAPGQVTGQSTVGRWSPPVSGRPVAVVEVDAPVVERSPGSIAAVREAAISSRIIARVQEILVRPGQRVAKGTPLAILDSRDLESRYAQTQKQLAGADARLVEAKANFERMKSVTAGAISKSQIDSAEAAFHSAKSEVESMQKQLEVAQVSLSYATIRSPYDAVVIDRFAEPGDLASPSRPLLGVYDPSSMRLEAWVRESIAIGLKPGDSVGVLLDALGEKLEGKVEEIVPQAEAGSRSFLVKVALPKRKNLYPGMFGRLLLPAGTVKRVLVPQRAVSRVGQLHFVVLADERNTRRLVVPGEPADNGRIEILSGVSAGESVIVP